MNMSKRLTIALDDTLELALREAPARLRLPQSASSAERLREYARLGYEATLDEERLATYRRWADDPEIAEVPRATVRRAARRGVFGD